MLRGGTARARGASTTGRHGDTATRKRYVRRVGFIWSRCLGRGWRISQGFASARSYGFNVAIGRQCHWSESQSLKCATGFKVWKLGRFSTTLLTVRAGTGSRAAPHISLLSRARRKIVECPVPDSHGMLVWGVAVFDYVFRAGAQERPKRPLAQEPQAPSERCQS